MLPSRTAQRIANTARRLLDIFSKTAPFTPAEIQRCRAAQDPHRLRVILLSDRELEPYFVYERTEKGFEIHSAAISFEDLARATQHIYFEPRPKRQNPVGEVPQWELPMANTNYLKSIVEDHVRGWLKEKFGQSFAPAFLSLAGVQGVARTHEFDAVSADGHIVCSIKTASWKTNGGNRGDGKIGGAYRELYFLGLVTARDKYLVLTDPEFFQCFTRETGGRLINGVTLLHCPLPHDSRGR